MSRSLFLFLGNYKRLLGGASLLTLLGAGGVTARAQTADTNWTMVNGDYAGTRYVALDQINRKNVGQLKEAFTCPLNETTGFQSSPVVAGNRLFVTTGTGTFAFDAATGSPLWKRTYDAQPNALSLNIGVPHRGLAYADGTVYRTTNNGHVLAYNASDGNLVWDRLVGDASKGEYMTMAPLVWHGRVLVATAGSDIAAIGRVIGLEQKTGKSVWSFDIVPTTGPGSETWSPAPTHHRAGGGVYAAMSLDPKTGILYTPTGNPGPDFDGDYRPGDNLYTCSVVMLDAQSGALRGYRQFVKHDIHDWDIAAAPALFTSKAGRAMVAVAGKSGYLWGVSRDLKTPLFTTPITTIENADAPLTPEGTHFAPGTNGGVNWNGPAYSPQTNAIYVPSIDMAFTVKKSGENMEYAPGKPFWGAADFGKADDTMKGYLTAVDADTGKMVWRYNADLPLVAAVTPTSGGLVFTGDQRGNLLAFDAKTGRVLLKTPTGNAVGGGVTVYSVNGREYVAVAAGLKSELWKSESGPAKVVVFALPASPRAAGAVKSRALSAAGTAAGRSH